MGMSSWVMDVVAQNRAEKERTPNSHHRMVALTVKPNAKRGALAMLLALPMSGSIRPATIARFTQKRLWVCRVIVNIYATSRSKLQSDSDADCSADNIMADTGIADSSADGCAERFGDRGTDNCVTAASVWRLIVAHCVAHDRS